MGCDIHTVTEVKTPDGWKAVLLDKPAFNWRAYRMYGFLADVRNCSSCSSPWSRRDWPKNITQEATDLRARWEGDAHSFTYVTLAELQAFDYAQPVEDRRVAKQVGPNSWIYDATAELLYVYFAGSAELGGGTMTTYRDLLGTAFFDELRRLSTLGKPEDVRVLMFFDN